MVLRCTNIEKNFSMLVQRNTTPDYQQHGNHYVIVKSDVGAFDSQMKLKSLHLILLLIMFFRVAFLLFHSMF